MDFRLSFAAKDLTNSVRRVWLFCMCLILGVCLIMVAGALYQMLDRSLLSDTRALMGGDVEIEANQALDGVVLAWISQQGGMSLTRELNTMLRTSDGEFMLVELLSTDEAYPLYGELILQPSLDLQQATAKQGERWGAALDPVLADRLGAGIGDLVSIGALEVEVRALVLEQPDRRLNADWRGAPVLVSEGMLNASGLVHPASRIEYAYRIRTTQNAEAWKMAFMNAFPDTNWEISTFKDRSERITERLDQIASGVLIVAFSTLFIGGLGIYNSVSVYLSGKRDTIATLKSIGLRNGMIVQIYALQVAMLAVASGLIGIVLGSVLAWSGSIILAQELPLALSPKDLFTAALVALLFGLITAFTFAMPAMGRSLSVEAASLFRDEHGAEAAISRAWLIASVLMTLAMLGLVLWLIPNVLFGLGFLAIVALCLGFFEVVVRAVRRVASNMEGRVWLLRSPAWRFALANLHRPGTPLRVTLLSLGAALTLLVACTVVVVSLLRLVHNTIPEESPALILYDVRNDQLETLGQITERYASLQQLSLSPLVRGRISGINGTPVRDLASTDIDWQEMARDEHKLSYLSGNIDGIRVVEGGLWTDDQLSKLPDGVDFLFAMEDREANQMALQPGDRVRFSLVGQSRTGLLVAIYSQQGIQTRFWFEAIFSGDALDPFINMHVGTVYMSNEEALALQAELARSLPNVVTVRTQDLVDSASGLLNKATQGLAVVSSISLIVSLLVLASVMAAGREKQTYHAVILHCLGARMSYIRAAIRIEYALLGAIVSMFSIGLGLAIAALILQLRLKIFETDLYWLGVLLAFAASALIFGLGARYLFSRLSLQPASLLREAG